MSRLLTAAALLALAAASPCPRLRLRYPEWARSPLAPSASGTAQRVELACGGAPACAAAHVLLAALAARRVAPAAVRRRPLRLARLAAALPPDPYRNSSLLVVAVTVAWVPAPPVPYAERQTVGLAAPRLAEYGASSVPARRRLFVRLAPSADPRRCAERRAYRFYGNRTLLADCHFLSDKLNTEVPLYVVADPVDTDLPENNETLVSLENELAARVSAAALPLRLRRCTRARLLAALRDDRSLLFLDYELWEEPAVAAVLPPPCAAHRAPCSHELDPAVALRVADLYKLMSSDVDAELFKICHRFSLTRLDLRQILEMATKSSMEVAACDWLLEHGDRPDRWLRAEPSAFTVLVFYCREDAQNYTGLQSDLENYLNITTNGQISKVIAKHVNCSNAFEMREELRAVCERRQRETLVGALAAGGAGAAGAADEARRQRVPLLLYGAPAPRLPGAWALAPRRLHELALARFLRDNRWTRLAVLCDASDDHRLRDSLPTDIMIRDIHLDLENIEQVLSELRRLDARIIYINANYASAVKVVRGAVASRMTDESKYVWIAREWQRAARAPGVRVFSAAAWRAGEQRVLGAPPCGACARAPALLLDALWLLASAVRDVWSRAPHTKQDMRHETAINELESVLHEKSFNGSSQQNLKFKNHALESGCIYLEEWRGERARLLVKWHVNSTAVPAAGPGTSGALSSPPPDGAASCALAAGDRFAPTCYDWAPGCALLAGALGALAGWLALRLARRRLARRDRELLARLLAQRDLVTATLADWLVDRSALHVLDELGAGQYGRVHLALLRMRGAATRAVAAKALLEDATPEDESDFLREACTLASLAHPHVLRLIAVCVAGGPPLMITEVAFFGDLLKYLSARRHFVEAFESDPGEAGAGGNEASHVSAESLTRLVREAASALAFLASRGVVHRDVRAANCLVDAARSLKLADFGLARQTGEQEYVCMRRTLVPVRWMAPESLAHGVFSSASDVWALGVLAVEAVTLGARPFGGIPLQLVPQFVARGGRPALPRSASPATVALTSLCWRSSASARPSAAEVEAYLRASPRALAPALDGDSCADSGFGEPSTPDSSTPPLDCYRSISETL